MNAEIKASAGSGGPSRRKADSDNSDMAYELGVLAGKVGSVEDEVSGLKFSVGDAVSKIATLAANMDSLKESVTKLDKTVSDQLQKLIDAGSDGMMKAFRDSLRQDAWIRRGFWGAVVFLMLSLATTMSVRLFGVEATEIGTDAAKSFKGTQTEMVEEFMPADETGEPSQ